MLKRILVPVSGDGMGETALAHAAALAHRHKAHIVVAHCRARPEDMIPYSTLLPSFARETIMTQASELADQEENALREALHGMAGSLDLSETESPDGTRATVEFVEEFGRVTDIVKHNGRLADLVVVVQPDRDRNLGTNALKAALFQTGRPVLMCPRTDGVDPDFGARIAVGWNGSLEAARTVALTLDLAVAADSVTILAGGRGEPHGATTEELADYYRLRGIAAVIHRFEARKPGLALLEKTTETGAGLLIMGAYGHSHERETLFGGNTQSVVDKAKIPVVMAH
ncbi:universal stress protein [Roseibacterium sp. SDUM158016]|jgi:nucleotide-binding universal stress UspA family protein|uniref:universal stress protein n=1 Tax=Roseicyclus sediminis TaxID=2980997 RepID=UPI0021D15323|nr:universal stress protein [Roseibacterium sp. SDUM158016]MCU4651699.1 universal stress protein [Roseibacterium sp. SDUM158016]